MTSSDDPEGLRAMSDAELCHKIAGFQPEDEIRILGLHELERRRRRPDLLTARVAVAISFVSLLVSIATAILSYLFHK